MKKRTVADELVGLDLCRGLPERVMSELAGCGRFQVFKPGQLLLHEGEHADRVHLIRSGSVAIEIGPPRGEPLVVETLGPGEMVGVSWLLPPHRNVFDGRARAETHVISLDADCLRSKFDEDHELGYLLVRQFAGTIRDRLQAARLQLLDLYGDA